MHWIDWLFPTGVCTFCTRPQRRGAPWVCRACLRRISWVTPPCCRRCGRPIRGQAANLCQPCRAKPPPWEWACHLGVYEGPLQAHLYKLKFEGRRQFAKPLGTLLGHALCKQRRLPRDTIVVPVPLHARRLRARGYNQAELLAQACAGAVRRPCVAGALVRHKDTAVQATLRISERMSNLGNAFSVRAPNLVRQRFVLLVDDIFTTGATASAATIALLRAGARGVGVACAAVAVAERDLLPPVQNAEYVERNAAVVRK